MTSVTRKPYKVVVVSGGTGSVALQTGFLKHKVDYSVLCNLFDNGKSTGVVRRIYSVLGPSDMRKNHTLRSPNRSLSGLLNARVTGIPDILNLLLALEHTMKIDLDVDFAIQELYSFLEEDVRACDNFCVGNIAYAHLFKKYGVEETNRIFSELLHIPEDSFVISHVTNAHLYCLDSATFEMIPEEHVATQRCSPISYRLIGVDASNTLSDAGKKALLEADVIIISSGTAWSSLIPTIGADGFKECIQGKPILGIINKVKDVDFHDRSIIEYCNYIEKYLGRFIDWMADDLTDGELPYGCYSMALSKENTEATKHDPDLLAEAVIERIEKWI